MVYAIVDIETTGSYASGNDITEIAVYCFDGNSIVSEYQTLIRPDRAIPYAIQVLTGITNSMVAAAPKFEEVAGHIAGILEGKVFVAHNVNFDYSFLKHNLSLAGYTLNNKKLCTVRLARKIFPGLPSYSLGNLCRSLDIPIQNRHRAGGDALATAILFEKLLSKGGEEVVQQFIKRASKEKILPVNLPAETVENLPYCPGVYYFHNQKGTVIYVGKAKNLKYRVTSHFSNNVPGKKKQEFLRNIFHISYQPCGTELMAGILEVSEIKRLWPVYNSALKRYEPAYGLYTYEDSNGYNHIVIDKQKKGIEAFYQFDNLGEAHSFLKSFSKKHLLCPKLNSLQSGNKKCSGINEGYCNGACEGQEPALLYNFKVAAALQQLKESLPSLAVIDSGLTPEENSFVLIEKGKFAGMGYFPSEHTEFTEEYFLSKIQKLPDNSYIRNLIYQFINKQRGKVVILKNPNREFV